MRTADAASPLDRFLRGNTGLAPGMRCLDAGCGTGAALVPLQEIVRPDGVVVGVDVDDQALAAADAATWALPHVALCRADVRRLPFGDAAFDAAYASLLFLWAGHPGEVVAELRRVVRAGGRLAIVDVDLSTMRFEPPLASWPQFVVALAAFQEDRGLDGEIGRKLYRLLAQAGFRDARVRATLAVARAGTPQWSAAWQLVSGALARALVDGGYLDAAELEDLTRDADSLMSKPGSLFVPGTTYAVSAIRA